MGTIRTSCSVLRYNSQKPATIDALLSDGTPIKVTRYQLTPQFAEKIGFQTLYTDQGTGEIDAGMFAATVPELRERRVILPYVDVWAYLIQLAGTVGNFVGVDAGEFYAKISRPSFKKEALPRVAQLVHDSDARWYPTDNAISGGHQTLVEVVKKVIPAHKEEILIMPRQVHLMRQYMWRKHAYH